MELWNTRKLNPPPTYTYKAKRGEVDTMHLRTTLDDGIKFFKEQGLINIETSLLARIVYRMKSKFRGSKDFQSLEKVKKDLMRFLEINIVGKLKHFVSILPHEYAKNIHLPTKNMIDFILVQLQGIGKLLCHTVEMCLVTAKFFEYRFHLGHFWKIGLIAFGLASRIYILALNIIKFTCHLYVRLLPFSHKLKNSGIDWLPQNYAFPKDLKDWLKIEWPTFDQAKEVIEVPDNEFNISLIDLVDDSDDDVEFCNEYIEVDDEDLEIIQEFEKLKTRKVESLDLDKSVTILRGFASDDVDIGEEIPSDDDDFEKTDNTEEYVTEVEIQTKVQESDETDVEEIFKSDEEMISNDCDLEKTDNTEECVPEVEIQTKFQESDVKEIFESGEEMISNDCGLETTDNTEECVPEVQIQIKVQESDEIDVEKMFDLEEDEVQIIEDSMNNSIKPEEIQTQLTASEIYISSDEEFEESNNNNSVQIIQETNTTKQKPICTSEEFISLSADSPEKTFKHQKRKRTNKSNGQVIKQENRDKPENGFSTEEFISLNTNTPVKTYTKPEKIQMKGISSRFYRKKKKYKNSINNKNNIDLFGDKSVNITPILKKRKLGDSDDGESVEVKRLHMQKFQINIKKEKEHKSFQDINSSFFKNIKVTSTPFKLNFEPKNSGWETTCDIKLNVSTDSVKENEFVSKLETNNQNIISRNHNVRKNKRNSNCSDMIEKRKRKRRYATKKKRSVSETISNKNNTYSTDNSSGENNTTFLNTESIQVMKNIKNVPELSKTISYNKIRAIKRKNAKKAKKKL